MPLTNANSTTRSSLAWLALLLAFGSLTSGPSALAQDEQPKQNRLEQAITIDHTRLVEFDRETATLRPAPDDASNSGTRTTTVKLAAISRIQFPAIPRPDKQSYLVRLVDGSTIRAGQVTLADDQITLLESSEPADRATEQTASVHTLSIRNIQSVLLVPLDNEFEEQWQQVNQRQGQTGDRLVFQRDTALDFLEGSVQKIDEAVVSFRMSDRISDAPRERVTGLVFYHAEGRQFRSPTAIVRTAAGSTLQVEACQVAADRVTVKTSSGSELTWPTSELIDISFDSTRGVWLSDLEPTTTEWLPVIASPSIVADLAKLNRPRFNESFDRQPLRLWVEDGTTESATMQTFARGIAIKGGSRLVFGLQQPFKQLTGTVGFAPSAAEQGEVEIVIVGDGRELYREILLANEQQTKPLNLNIDSVKRLTIRVNYHDGSGIGDLLHLCDLRVTR